MRGYGAADTTSISPMRTEQLILSDGQGDFGVAPEGAITVLSGYPNVGRVFTPGSASYDQVVKNLSSVGDNRNRLISFLGAARVTTALSSPPLVTADGAQATTADVVAVVPYRERWWFYPAVTLTVTGTLTLGWLAWLRWGRR